jgi:hypothetical protein
MLVGALCRIKRFERSEAVERLEHFEPPDCGLRFARQSPGAELFGQRDQRGFGKIAEILRQTISHSARNFSDQLIFSSEVHGMTGGRPIIDLTYEAFLQGSLALHLTRTAPHSLNIVGKRRPNRRSFLSGTVEKKNADGSAPAMSPTLVEREFRSQ